MRILLFGPETITGKHIIAQALRQGYNVTAFVHDRAKIGIRHPALRILYGGVCDPRAVDSAMKKQEAVIFAMESKGRSHSKMLSDATATIIRSMEAHRIRRFVCISSVGVLGSDAGLLHRHIIIPLFKKHEFIDRRRQLEIIMQSNLDWIVVRHARISDGPRMAKYRVSMVRAVGGKISHANVADFMIKQLTQDRFLREMPIVSG